TLAPNATVSCTNPYTITQADLDGSSVTNTATASGGGATSPVATATVTAVQTKALTLTKTAAPTTYSTLGTVITYTYVVKNTGNRTLGPAQFTVTDNTINGGLSLHDALPISTLAPNATVSCTKTYTITQADLDNGSVTNTASATGGGATS